MFPWAAAQRKLWYKSPFWNDFSAVSERAAEDNASVLCHSPNILTSKVPGQHFDYRTKRRNRMHHWPENRSTSILLLPLICFYSFRVQWSQKQECHMLTRKTRTLEIKSHVWLDPDLRRIPSVSPTNTRKLTLALFCALSSDRLP